MQVHQHDIGVEAPDLPDGVIAVDRDAHDVDPGEQPEQHGEPIADDLLVVRDEHSHIRPFRFGGAAEPIR